MTTNNWAKARGVTNNYSTIESNNNSPYAQFNLDDDVLSGIAAFSPLQMDPLSEKGATNAEWKCKQPPVIKKVTFGQISVPTPLSPGNKAILAPSKTRAVYFPSFKKANFQTTLN